MRCEEIESHEMPPNYGRRERHRERVNRNITWPPDWLHVSALHCIRANWGTARHSHCGICCRLQPFGAEGSLNYRADACRFREVARVVRVIS